MTKLERMTNYRMTNNDAAASGTFELGTSFIIRHSDFDISFVNSSNIKKLKSECPSSGGIIVRHSVIRHSFELRHLDFVIAARLIFV